MGKKHREKLYQKSGCLGFFVEVQERKANRRNEKKKVCEDRKKSLGGKTQKERRCCLQHDSTASVHVFLWVFSAEQETAKGEKCLVVLVGQKRGTHDWLWPKRKKTKTKMSIKI